MKEWKYIGLVLLVCFDAYRPGKQFFSHVGTEPALPGYYQYFFFFWGGGGKYVLLKDTTRQPEWGSNPRPLDPESEVLTTRPPRPPQEIHSEFFDETGSGPFSPCEVN